MTQDLGAGVVTTRLAFPNGGVMRYEVINCGGVAPLATAIASSSDGHEHFYGFGEKFDGFDQAGNKVRILTFDQPITKKQYKTPDLSVGTAKISMAGIASRRFRINASHR